MKIKSESEKQRLCNRLHRIEGQIHGITRMINEERECAEVLQQLSAARSALQATIEAFTEQMVNGCLLSDDLGKEERRKLAAEMLAVIRKA